MVRAKFTLQSFETMIDYGSKKEVRSLNLSPVVGGSEENKKVYAWTPGGSIKLSTVNQEAWKHFELGKEYYVDFSPANEEEV